MSAFNGSGTFVISGVGLPFVTGTTISSTVSNQLNTDLATGLTNCITKDGQTTTTAIAPFGSLGLSTDFVLFPSTQVPSANPNAMDDYEEGAFTPAVTFGGAAVGITFSARGGSYTKIGNRVFFSLTLTLSSKGSSTGTALITGLPFACSGNVPVSFGANNLSAGVVALPLPEVNNGATTITIYNFTAAAGTISALTDTAFTNTTDIQIAGNYAV